MSIAPNLFHQRLQNEGLAIERKPIEILQVNVGKLCNLTCLHCHVNAGPNRKEIIRPETVDRLLEWYEKSKIPTLDITGGSPEMVPDFRRLIQTVRERMPGRRIMDRLNPTILMEPGYEDLATFLAGQEVELIASMPCYSPENVTEQRGEGVFDASIAAFRRLNELGYGRDPRLRLHFVYNPNGAFLPGVQADLERDYKKAMKEHFDIDFNDLFALANMPIARFASYLKNNGRYEEYLALLREAFNGRTVDGLMCRNTLNVSWEGEIFDCDFNQMMGLPLRRKGETKALHLWDIDPSELEAMPIRTGNHCFGCTAGSGSSCGGSLA
ncbi:MAG: arsenosugar biosynthesis radical SAM (seleno)protein ArsS [Verrucomicrobiota bacterium]